MAGAFDISHQQTEIGDITPIFSQPITLGSGSSPLRARPDMTLAIIVAAAAVVLALFLTRKRGGG
jgi:hypothetical protein